jgi:hypothetical protein
MEVKGYEHYLIYPDGRVWSKNRKIWKIPVVVKRCHRFRNPEDKGYLSIQLNTPVIKRFLVHRLVAIHYIPNPDNLPQVDHMDNDKHNNNVDNLQWIDNKGNCESSKRLLRCDNPTGHIGITPNSRGGFSFRKQIGDIKINRWFKTIEEALEYGKKVEEGNSDWRKPSPPPKLDKTPCPICETLISKGNMTTHIKRQHPGKIKLRSTISTGHMYIHNVTQLDGSILYRYYRMINGERHQKDGFKTIEEAVKYKDSLTKST